MSASACGSDGANGGRDAGAGSDGTDSGISTDGTDSGTTTDGGSPDGAPPTARASLKVSLIGSTTRLVAPGSKTRIDVRIERTGPRRPVVLHLAGFGTDFVAPDATVVASDDTGSLLVTASQAVTSEPKNGAVEAGDGALKASTPLTLAGAREMPDPGFGKQGTVTLGTPIQDVLPLPDGRLVVSLRGAVGSPVRPIRIYDGRGQLDTTFGTKGEANVGRPTGHLTSGEGRLAVQPDGRILYATSMRPYAAGSTSSLGVARLLPTGTLDTSFGNQGWAQVPFAGFAGAWVTGLALETDGGLVVAGTLSVDGQVADPLKRRAGLARFTASGAPDGAFGTSGAVVMAWGGTNGSAEGLRTLGGSTYVMGYGDATAQGNTYVGHVGRLTANGSLDASFGTSGVLTTSTGILDVLLPPAGLAGGKLVVAYDGGSFAGSVGLVSATTGAADTTVSASGRFTHAQGGATAAYTGPALPVVEPSGRILVLMGSIDRQRMEVLAYSATGVPDMTYARSGTLAFAGGSYVHPVRAVPLADGRIVVAANGKDGTAVLGAFFP